MDRFVYGLEITAIATALVAGTLSILALAMFLLKKLALWLQRQKDSGSRSRDAVKSRPRAQLPAQDQAPASEAVPSGIIAVITASLSAYLSRPAHEIKIRSVRQTSGESPVFGPSQWARAGRQERLFGRQNFHS